MKKIFCFALALILVLVTLTACSFTSNSSSKGALQCSPTVTEMLTALVDNRQTDAKALLHRDAQNKDAAISQLCSYIAGRRVKSLELVNTNIKTSISTSGNSREEHVSYKVGLIDGEVIYISAVYLSNSAGIGFVSFQLVIGVI